MLLVIDMRHDGAVWTNLAAVCKCEDVGCVNLAPEEGPLTGSCTENNQNSGSIQLENIGMLIELQLLTECSVSWS
jgi:hypothetical protein